MSFYRYFETADEQTVEVSTGEANPTAADLWNGTRMVTVRDNLTGHLISQTTYHVANAVQVAAVSRELYGFSDEFGRAQRVTYLDGTYAEMQSGCSLIGMA